MTLSRPTAARFKPKTTNDYETGVVTDAANGAWCAVWGGDSTEGGKEQS